MKLLHNGIFIFQKKTSINSKKNSIKGKTSNNYKNIFFILKKSFKNMGF
jgi:hypothetical protein